MLQRQRRCAAAAESCEHLVLKSVHQNTTRAGESGVHNWPDFLVRDSKQTFW